MKTTLSTILQTSPALCIVKAVTMFRVYEDRDKTEGRSGSDLRFTVPNKREAEVLSEGLGPMGTRGRIEEAKYLHLELCEVEGVVRKRACDSFYVPAVTDSVAADMERSILRAQAVAKLTPAERASLGV